MIHVAVIGLGSNIEPFSNIPKAIEELSQRFHVFGISTFIETKPVGLLNQPDFLNGSVLLETDLTIAEMTDALKKIEHKLGRRPSKIKFGPRPIDLDIVVWNDDIVDPDYHQRDFLKKSVLELLPNIEE